MPRHIIIKLSKNKDEETNSERSIFYRRILILNDSNFLIDTMKGRKTYCASANRGELSTVNSIPRETMLMKEGKMETFSDEEK